MRPGLSPHGAPALFREDAQRRLLFACVSVSIALHAAVLVACPGFRPVEHAKEAQVLTAALVSKPAHPAAPRAMPKPLHRPQWSANPETALPVFTDPEPPARENARRTDPTPSSPIPEAASASPDAASTPAPSPENTMARGVDAGLLEKYRLALIDAAGRYKRYPSHAMERGWQGRVEVRLVVGSNGNIRSALIKRSSNYRILDDQALDMVKKGTGREPIPSALHGREFTLDIPVIFELQAG
jgi:protein TonB